MKYSLTMLCVLVCATFASASTDSDARAAIALASARNHASSCGCGLTGQCDCVSCECAGKKSAAATEASVAYADGWQYDASRGVWWKHVEAPAIQQYVPYYAQPQFQFVPTFQASVLHGGGGNCAGGR